MESYKRKALLKDPNLQRRSAKAKRQKSDATKATAWTLLTNHGHVVVLLGLNPELTIRDLALNVGITERAVQRILSDLQRDEFIQIKKVGRRNTYQVDTGKHFRHPIEEKCQIKSLITVIKQAQALSRDL